MSMIRRIIRAIYGAPEAPTETPQEYVARLNKYDTTRGRNVCGSTKSRYDIGADALVCTECGSQDDRKWVLAHPELSA